MSPSFKSILVLLLGCLLSTGPALAQKAPHHEISVTIDSTLGLIDVVDRITLEGPFDARLGLGPEREISQLSMGPGSEKVLPPGRLILAKGEARTVSIAFTLPTGSGDHGDGIYLSAERWLPWLNEQPISYQLDLSVALPDRAVTSGRLVAETQSDGRYSARFVQDRPGEPPTLFVGPYSVGEAALGPILLRSYLHDDVVGLSAEYLALSAAYIEHFASLIGPYPFSAFHVVSAPYPVGYGFPGLTYIDRRILPYPFVKKRSLAHEVLHNWWGNGVLVDYETGNWSEGLTTYLADYLLAAPDKQARRNMRYAWLRDYAALPASDDAPVRDFIARQHTAAKIVGYNKVAYIFHMLSRHIGPAALDEGLRQFWQRHQHAVASWAQLRASFEDASGQDLSSFFSQWVERAGAPRLGLGDAKVAESGSAFSIDLELTQETPPFNLNVPVVIETEVGQEIHNVALSGTQRQVRIISDRRPMSLSVDPDYHLFRHLAPGEAPPIFRDVTLESDVAVVIASNDPSVAAIARSLAQALLETTPNFTSWNEVVDLDSPLLVIGLQNEVDELLARSGLPSTPSVVVAKGSARVWVREPLKGKPLMVVAADDGRALEALLRPLPHYGRQGYMVFDGRQAIIKGEWPPSEHALQKRL